MKSLRPKYEENELPLDELIKAQQLRRLRIENDLRIWYGRGLIIALFLILVCVFTLAFLSGFGVLSVVVAVSWKSVLPVGALVGVLLEIARRLFTPSK